LGLTVARDGYVYATRNTHTDAIGRVRREGEQGEVEP
jgi:predicted transcriptional regulator